MAYVNIYLINLMECRIKEICLKITIIYSEIIIKLIRPAINEMMFEKCEVLRFFFFSI